MAVADRGLFSCVSVGSNGNLPKQSAQAATGPALYLIALGGASAIVGMVWALVWQPSPWTGQGIVFAITAGVCFGTATGLINYALSTYTTPVSKLAPIWSCNVLVTLAIGATVLGEAAEVNLVKLITGAILIVVGAMPVGNS